MRPDAKRVQARVPAEVYEKILHWADRLGLSASQLSGMAIQSGLDSIIRAVAPTESFTPEQWADVIAAANKKGLLIPELDHSMGDLDGEKTS